MANFKHQRYAIVGTGAVGGLYGGLLARAGIETHFYSRSDVSVIAKHGLHVQTPHEAFALKPVNVYSSTRKMPPCDVVVVCLKTTANTELASLLKPIIHDRTIVVVLQNGLFVEEDAAAIVGTERVVGGVCFLCAAKTAPGKIAHQDFGRVVLGPYRGVRGDQPAIANEVINEIVQTWSSAQIAVTATDDLLTERWKKLMWNIPFNGLTCILQTDTKSLLSHASARSLIFDIMEEVRSAAVASGCPIPESHRDRLVADTDHMVPYASSMYLDFQARRPLEIDAIYRRPVQVANQHGVDIPRVTLLMNQLEFLNQHHCRSKT